MGMGTAPILIDPKKAVGKATVSWSSSSTRSSGRTPRGWASAFPKRFTRSKIVWYV